MNRFILRVSGIPTCSFSFVNNNVHFISKNMSSSSSIPNKCAIAVCQFNATNNKLQNLEIVQRLVKNAAQENAKVCFRFQYPLYFINLDTEISYYTKNVKL